MVIKAYPFTIGSKTFDICCTVDEEGIVDILCGLAPDGTHYTVEDLVMELQQEGWLPHADSIFAFETLLDSCERSWKALDECTIDGPIQDIRNKFSEDLADGWDGAL